MIGNVLMHVLNNKNKRRWLLVVGVLLICAAVGWGILAWPDGVEDGDENTVEGFAWDYINQDIDGLEAGIENKYVDGEWVTIPSQYRIIDKRITRLEKVAEYNNYGDYMIDVWALEYRLLPDDLSKVVMAGGMTADEEGWLTQTTSCGHPYLVIKDKDGVLTYIGATTELTVAESGGMRQAIKELIGSSAHVDVNNKKLFTADRIEEIQIKMYYRGEITTGTIHIPKENSQGIAEMIDIMNAGTSTGAKSVNDFPACDRVVQIALLPGKIVYLYEKDSVYYAEIPYESIMELTKEDYQQVLGYFGPIRPFPEDMDKTEFLPAIQDMLQRYRSGNPPENPMEYMFDVAPEGVALPEVNAVDDFELRDGDGTECLYQAVIPFGDDDAYEIKMLLKKQYQPGNNGTEWTVSGVSFSEPYGGTTAEWFFDLAIANRFDYVPEFEEGRAPCESPDYLYYAFILNLGEWKAGQQYLTKEYVEDVITSHFEVEEVIHQPFEREWNFDGAAYTVARPGSYRCEPVYGLKEFDRYNKDGRTIYDVAAEEYSFDEFAHTSTYDYELPSLYDTGSLSRPMQYVLDKKLGKIKSGKLQVWSAIREMIAESDTAGFTVTCTERFKFYIDGQTGEVVFLAHSIESY